VNAKKEVPLRFPVRLASLVLTANGLGVWRGLAFASVCAVDRQVRGGGRPHHELERNKKAFKKKKRRAERPLYDDARPGPRRRDKIMDGLLDLSVGRGILQIGPPQKNYFS